MQQAKVIDFPKTSRRETRTRGRLNAGKSGRVYARGDKLWVDFYYLGAEFGSLPGWMITPATGQD